MPSYAYALNGYGIIVRIADLIKHAPVENNPSCDHPERLGNAFCPVCGTKVEVIRKVRTDQIHALQQALLDPDMPQGFLCTEITMLWPEDWDKQQFFVGWGRSLGGYGGPCISTFTKDLVPTDEIMHKEIVYVLSKALHRAGLPQELLDVMYKKHFEFVGAVWTS